MKKPWMVVFDTSAPNATPALDEAVATDVRVPVNITGRRK
jgi:hypothetical protein